MGFIDKLDDRLIKVGLKSSEKDDIIKELLDLLNKAGKLSDYDEALQAVIKREQDGSTGMGNGIAIPHAKISGLDDVVGAVGISHEGKDFESLDGKPVNVFFLVISPEHKPESHMQALSEISKTATNPLFMDSVLRAKTASGVIKLFEEINS